MSTESFRQSRANGQPPSGLRRLGLLVALALVAVGPAAAQCLRVQVVDPLDDAVPNATVAIGAKEVPTDDAGIAAFCELGAGPHTVTVAAPDFQSAIESVQQSEGLVTIRLELGIVTQEVVVVGSRAQPRSVIESAVPVDVVLSDDFVQQGGTDVTDQLRNIVPSFNVNTQPISDAATIVRPTSLRNLAPDHTLVLVNGKRRHRAAVITWLGNGVADGAQGPDISVIPAIALEQVEVLRDGASAQYGSDAIAGVLNFRLKDAPSGGSMEVRTGRYSAGDGRALTFAANVGLPLGDKGFANLSIEYGNSGPTSRSVQRNDAKGLIAAGNTNVRDPAQIWGAPEIDDDVKFWGNFGRLLGETTQLYAHTNYASKKVTGGFYFRNPNNRGAVFSADRGKTLLIGDALDAQAGGEPMGRANCPTVPVTNNVPDPTALRQVFDDPNCFSFQERFPGGFTPQFGGTMVDQSIVAGIRGQFSSRATWDASVIAGSNEVDFFIMNTVNASLGPDTPTEFDPGLYRQQDLAFNFDLTYAVNDMTHLAAGAEWRDETFGIGIGQLESYQIGPYAAQGFSSASNGFPGFSDIAAGEWSRSNIAVYGDAELQGDGDNWTLGAAVRAERFADFGTTVNYKLAARKRLTDLFALRASLSTGFRAPTPGQQNAFNVSTQFDSVLMDLVNNGTIPSTSRVAALRGGEQLEAEKSRNFSAGAVVGKGPFVFTADYFRVALRDRLALTTDFSLTENEIEGLLAEGVTSARNLANFRFFTNDFNTLTQGLDLVATYTPVALGGDTDFTFLFNHTNTEVTEYSPDVLGAGRIRELQEALPETRWNVSVRQAIGKLDVLGRLSWFDSWYDGDDDYVYSGNKFLVDLELSYPVTERFTFSIGGQNIFNTFSDPNPFAADAVGNRYSQFTPFGYNGAYYYMRLNYSWKGSM